MTDYKLVPVEQLKDWHERINTVAADTAFNVADEMEAILGTAPAVQGEPVAYMFADDWGRTRIVLGKETAEHWTPPEGTIEPLYAAPQPAEQQPDDAAVDRFCTAMKAKLAKKRQEGRGGWQYMSVEQLSTLLYEHVRKGDPLDVGNIAMMIHQNGQRIEQQPKPDVAGLAEALCRCRHQASYSIGGEDALSIQLGKVRDIANEALAAYRKESSNE